MPTWLAQEKCSQAKALALIDKLLQVDAVFAFRSDIDMCFPTLRSEIERLGFKVLNHWHLPKQRNGINEWKARGAWEGIDPARTYMNYDRHFVFGNRRVVPEEGSNVIWHVDHMNYNLYYYLIFLLSYCRGKENEKCVYPP